jgi:hypothetical protein
MSRRINVNPAHYKVAGRERQGEQIWQQAERQTYAAQTAQQSRWDSRRESAPGWEDPAQPMAEAPAAPRRRRSKPRTTKKRRKATSTTRARATRRAKPAARARKPKKKTKKTARRST